MIKIDLRPTNTDPKYSILQFGTASVKITRKSPDLYPNYNNGLGVGAVQLPPLFHFKQQPIKNQL
jgi:hypothetical protein